MFKKSHSLWFVLLILVLLLTACSQSDDDTSIPKDASKSNSDNESPEQSDANDPTSDPEPAEKKITLAAVGDILIHDRVYDDVRTENGFDFMPMIADVRPFLQEPTITFANQETMIGGKAIGLSTYPRFNSPQEVGDALKQSGVDVVSLANNHTMDRGEEAIQRAIEHWDSIDMMHVGAYKNEASQKELRVMETDEDISVAFLAYAYGTNGIPVPEGKDYLVNLIDKDNIAEEIDRAKDEADVVVLSLHFGNEYDRMPNDDQKDLVQFAADQGVDIVLGHHPHVLQPMDWVKGENGQKTLAIYSLGNFLSGQDELYRQIGGMAEMTITKTIEDDKETVAVCNPKFLPTFVTLENDSNYNVVPMDRLSEEDLPGAQEYYEEIKEHMSQWMPDLEFIES